MKIYLGVDDVPEPESNLTTGAVADILEAKYGLFTKFADDNIQNIANHLADSVGGALETLNMGEVVDNPYKAATQQIDKDFRNFLSSERMAQLGVPGVPTKAALNGYSRRFKNRKGPRRPSLIDTGVLQVSFESKVE